MPLSRALQPNLETTVNIPLALLLLLCSFLVVGVVTERYFVPSLEQIARWLKLPEDVAGATLLAFGSSAPELFIALLTLLAGESTPSFGVGSIIGSALFQILVVIGFAATIKTAHLDWKPVVRDGVIYGAAVLVLFLFVRDGVLTLLEGGMLVGAYLVYLVLLLGWSRLLPERKRGKVRGASREEESRGRGRYSAIFRFLPDLAGRPGWTLPVFLLCLPLIGLGTWLFIRTGVFLAEAFGLDPTIVALTVIAGGSSVPELFSSAAVARRGKGDMAIANALGSNTFDIFVSLGLPVVIATTIHGPVKEVGGANIASSAILLLATLVMVIGLLALQRFRAGRYFGLFLLAAYAAYVAVAYAGWIG